MGIVAGADFGTLSVRVSIYDKERGTLGHASAEYPLLRSAQDHDFATQRHVDQMDALVRAMREAVRLSGCGWVGGAGVGARYDRVERDRGG